MENRRDMEVNDILQRQFHASCRETELVGHGDQRLQRSTAQRRREMPSQSAQIDVHSMIVCDHGEAGEPTFRNLGLTNMPNAGASNDPNVDRGVHLLPIAKRGSKSHSIKLRFSVTILAVSVIPGRSACRRPNAMTHG